MTLLITFIAAVITSIIWYTHDESRRYKTGTLALMYWGATIMWFIDFVAEYIELRAQYFEQGFSDILNDSLLGISVVAIGLCAWLIVLLVKDPKGLIKKSTN